MDSEQISRFENLCSDLYTAAIPSKRTEANSILNPMLSRIDSVPQFESVLGKSRNPHAILFAAKGLMQLISANWSATSEGQRDGLKQSLSQFLAQNCEQMYSNQLWEQCMSFVMRLLCRIVKLSWLDGPKYQKITEEIQPLIESNSLLHLVLGVDIYTLLTVDMQPTKGVQMSRLRRTAMSFRDTALPVIFTSSIRILRDIRANKPGYGDNRLMQKVLKLTNACLSFDFMGTIPDETADDQATVMIPYNWTNVKDLSDPSLFFEIYVSSVSQRNQQSAVQCLQCLVLFASFRRSLYSKEEERSAVLGSYMRGTSQILSSYCGLDNEECYHEFCRLLGRINAANQLTEISSNPQFSMWIDQVYTFTSTALNRINILPNSMHYLLGFWTALVPSTISMGSRAPGQITEYLEKIFLAFLDFRIKLAAGTSNEEETDPLDDETLLQEQLEDVVVFSKFVVKPAHEILVRAVNSANSEKTIVWLVYLMSAVIAGQVENMTVRRRSASVDDDGSPRGNAMAQMFDSSSQPESVSPSYLMVGDLSKKIFHLMSSTDNQKTSNHLELAYLYFLEQFKKLYLNEHSKITSLTVSRSEGVSKLCTAIGVANNDQIIDLLLSKIFSNLKNRKHLDDIVVKKTLAFFHDLVFGSSSTATVYSEESVGGPKSLSQTLMDNAKMQYLLSHHEEIDFDGRIDTNFNTNYYSIVFRLMFDNSSGRINWNYFDSLFSRIHHNGLANRSDAQGKLVVTLARNLKGVSIAANTSDQYNVLFKYLVENPRNPNQCKITIFSALADTWWDQPQVVVPIIKFIADFAHNRSNRIAFDPNSSPNGIVLFRESTKVLSAYGQRMLSLPPATTFRDIYEEKYKGIGAALALFTNTLGGNYANLGVFELYGDTSLTASMETSLKLCLSIPLEDLGSYLKSLKSVYTFLELSTRSNMRSLVQLSPTEFAHILRSLEDGLSSFETSVALSCCVAIDNICTYMIETTEPPEDVANIRSLVNSPQIPSAFSRILNIINHLAISGEFASTWSLSRPFLGIILLLQNEFQKLSDAVVSQQLTSERKAHAAKCYGELMTGISSNLTTKNRELFTKNLYQFGLNMRSS